MSAVDPWYNIILGGALSLALAGCVSLSSSLKEHSSMPSSTSPAVPSALALCQPTPNCVCSLDKDSEHGIAPFPLRSTLEESFNRLRQVIHDHPRTEIVHDVPTYLKVEFTSLIFRFTDDVEFLYDSKQKAIHIRSASRIGRSDLGANRKRMEKLRADYLR